MGFVPIVFGFVHSGLCMLAGFAFHDFGHNNAGCGMGRCDVNFLSGSTIPVLLEFG